MRGAKWQTRVVNKRPIAEFHSRLVSFAFSRRGSLRYFASDRMHYIHAFRIYRCSGKNAYKSRREFSIAPLIFSAFAKARGRLEPYRFPVDVSNRIGFPRSSRAESSISARLDGSGSSLPDSLDLLGPWNTRF